MRNEVTGNLLQLLGGNPNVLDRNHMAVDPDPQLPQKKLTEGTYRHTGSGLASARSLQNIPHVIAVPVTIGFGELYQALERGTVDCTQNYTAFVKSYKHYEVTSHLTEAFMGQFLAYGFAISLRIYDEMPKDLQDILVNTSKEYMDVYARNQIDFTKQARKELIAGIDGRKMQFHMLPDVERETWRKAGEAFTTSWLAKMEKKGIDGPAFLEKLAKVTAKYEAKLKAEGYPWEKTN